MNAPAPTFVPDWLAQPLDIPAKISNRDYMQQRFEIALERILDLIASGHTLEGALQQYPERFEIGLFNSWLHRDKDRRQRYEEAKEFRAEVWAGRAMRIADGVSDTPDSLPEEVSRSRLRVETIKFFLGADNRRVYAPTQQIDVTTTTISITAALDAAKQRAQQAIEGEFKRLPDPSNDAD